MAERILSRNKRHGGAYSYLTYLYACSKHWRSSFEPNGNVCSKHVHVLDEHSLELNSTINGRPL